MILHGYRKQGTKAPEREIEVALRRMQELWMRGNMVRKNMIRFEDWEAEKLKDAEFQAATKELEPGYQIARLRILMGITQAQLAEMVGTRQPSIARLENGRRVPSLTFLHKIATALNAKIEVRLVPEDKQPVIPHL